MILRVVFIVAGTFTVDDEEITNTLRRIYHTHHYIVCPHTAVAAAYHYRLTQTFDYHQGDNKQGTPPRAYIATASPAKFPEALQKAGVPPLTHLAAHLHSLPTRSLAMKQGEDWYATLRAKIEAITATRLKVLICLQHERASQSSLVCSWEGDRSCCFGATQHTAGVIVYAQRENTDRGQGGLTWGPGGDVSPPGAPPFLPPLFPRGVVTRRTPCYGSLG
ncbi:Threonine synthase-like 2 [Chionoecetes opilio]|uniref:Threonine synthase-like 2 n=1 Tax=Chionoecetes opilio TaxID=41210 RepID=A0A8J4XQ03_CHIOP|nr:Threonine synthase-like 2 [Chionoecetes opilio]